MRRSLAFAVMWALVGMMAMSPWLERGCFADAPAVGGGAGGGEKKAEALSSFLAEGAFTGLGEPLRTLITLRLDGTRVRLDREAWETPPGKAEQDRRQQMIETLVRKGMPREMAERHFANVNRASPPERAFSDLREAVGAGSTGTMMNTQGKTLYFGGMVLTGRLHLTETEVQIALAEVNSPGRSLDLRDAGDGSFRLLVTHPEGDVLMLSQAPGGEVVLMQITGGGRDLFTAHAPSFVKLYEQHRQRCVGQWLPALRRLGLGVTLSPDHPPVRQAVLDLLRPVSPEEQARYAAILANLEHPDYPTRKLAAEELEREAPRHLYDLRRRLDQPDLPPESRSAISAVIAKHARSMSVMEVIRVLRLPEDVPFLVDLMSDAAPADVAAIANRLRQITGESIADDAAAWRSWLQQRPPAEAPSP